MQGYGTEERKSCIHHRKLRILHSFQCISQLKLNNSYDVIIKPFDEQNSQWQQQPLPDLCNFEPGGQTAFSGHGDICLGQLASQATPHLNFVGFLVGLRAEQIAKVPKTNKIIRQIFISSEFTKLLSSTEPEIFDCELLNTNTSAADALCLRRQFAQGLRMHSKIGAILLLSLRTL